MNIYMYLYLRQEFCAFNFWGLNCRDLQKYFIKQKTFTHKNLLKKSQITCIASWFTLTAKFTTVPVPDAHTRIHVLALYGFLSCRCPWRPVNDLVSFNLPLLINHTWVFVRSGVLVLTEIYVFSAYYIHSGCPFSNSVLMTWLITIRRRIRTICDFATQRFRNLLVSLTVQLT